MRILKINTHSISDKKKQILYSHVEEIDSVDSEHRSFVIYCVDNHELSDGDSVSLILYRDEYIPATHIFNIKFIDNKIFQIDIPLYRKFKVKNYGTTLKLREVEDENGNKYIESYYTGDAILDVEDDFIYYYIRTHHSIMLRYHGEKFTGYINYIPGENDEDLSAKAIICDRPLEFEEGEVEIYLDWYLTISNNFNPEIEIFNNTLYYTIPLGLEVKEKYDLCDEQANLNNYMKTILSDIIPETIDNEKRQFSPVIKNGTEFNYANEIVFNLHFRDRYDENKNLRVDWKSTDEQFWNGMFKVNGSNLNSESDDYLRYNVAGYNDSLGDELNHLGFTEDDIRYSKKKIKKTSIRLLFYSTPNMLSRELLYYSTVFLDSNDLFNKYINIKGKGLKVFDNKRIDESLRLSTKFRITNKYDNTKSSEGFYMYLFPTEIENENEERTIYMKVEFNHAGYGKTIPMMLPTREEGMGVIKSTDNDFPINFIKNEEGLISTYFDKYQSSVMIPLKIKYDNKLRDYVYYFPFIGSNNDYKIELNLFEPRIKGFEGNGNS